MKITLFPADKGDCFLVTGTDGATLLVDGGMSGSYRQYVAPALGTLEAIDAVCVSHIDQDHIGGILRMMEDAVDWRVHDYHQSIGNADHPAPTPPRPPKIGRIWHNAFGDQVGKHAAEIEGMLSATASILSGVDALRDVSEVHQDVATGVADALRLSRRIAPEQMNIPLNPEFGGGLVQVGDDPVSLEVGSMQLCVIGPFEEDLARLRTEWDDWLERNQDAVKKIRELVPPGGTKAEMEASQILSLALAQAEILGDRNRVTAPNLSSIMLLIEDHGTTVLATGDGHYRDILKGLGAAGKLSGSGNAHVNVLKIPHHGSEYNIHPDFCEAVTADHYVFCASGAHQNPDLRVVELVIRSRVGEEAERSPNAEASMPFSLWFNASSAVGERESDRSHMKKVEDLVAGYAEKEPDRLHVEFRTQQSADDPGMEVRL